MAGSSENMKRTIVASAIQTDISKYEEVVNMLNKVQGEVHNPEKKTLQDRDSRTAKLKIPKMWSFAKSIGITEEDVDSLNVIHISGTKGKGSTCALCESLLRHQGYKTGFLSSPHLVEVRERIAINGVPLEREKFTTYFWEVYNKLNETKAERKGSMPYYVGFLLLLALRAFREERVDVAILEVGIGGEFDYTNMVRHPVVCGVTNLGLDHTARLGATIEEIAWHKAGIFKPGVPAYTVPHCPAAMAVLKQRALEKEVPLSVCPEISAYGADIKLGIKGSVQTRNASLALQLCNTWVQSYEAAKSEIASNNEKTSGVVKDKEESVLTKTICDIQIAMPFQLKKQHLLGLEQCQWLGRNQTIREPGITFYLDGAHTVESIQQCVEWFTDETSLETFENKNGVYRVLIFNTSRDPYSLIRPLLSCEFDAALFCPNIAYEDAMSADQTNNKITKERQLELSCNNKTAWENLNEQGDESCTDISNANDVNVNGLTNETHQGCSSWHLHIAIDGTQTVPQSAHDVKQNTTHRNQKRCELLTFPSISDCLNWISKRKVSLNQTESAPVESVRKKLNELSGKGGDINSANGGSDIGLNEVGVRGSETSKVQHIQVLVTGSLHLVGGALRVFRDKEL